jgi:protocatechuate 3,4-dioxygenase beta subunit
MCVTRMNGCAPVANANVEVWQCDASGNYSEYSQPGFNGTGQTFLRGVQTTDANGQATFTTIYPGWYAGRATHMHVEIFVNGAATISLA